MIIKINDERGFEQSTLYFGYLEENNSTTIEFEFPEYLEKYNKKLNFMLADGTTVCKLFNDINSNKFTFTRDLLKFNKLQMAIEFFDTEENLIYRTSILTIRISDSIICDDDVTEDDPKIIILDELIQKVNELNTETTENEATRESNEQTKISNEDTRVANETARQEYVTQLKKDVELGNLDGATFTPHVSESGDLSWSNNKNLTNPETVNIKGPKGDPGKQGEQGTPFRIIKTYPNVEAMQADFDNMQVGDYVMITSSVELEDNAKLYCKTETEWVYITDFSGATGIQGPKGEQGVPGVRGEKGDTGVGISRLEVIDGALYVTLTNNVRENAGLILTDEVKSWLVSQITDNAESDFNEFYNSKVSDFNSNAESKTTEYNTNAEDKLNEYNTNATNKISEYNSNAEAILKILPKTETEVLEEIDIDDAGESSFNKLSVFGNSRQASTEGYNLLNNILESQTVNGVTVTVNEDKSITLNGTSTGAITLNYTNDFGTINSDYIFYLIGKNNKINLQGIENGETVAYLAFSNNNNNVKKNYETDTIITRIFSYINAGTTFNNETFYPMITKGTEEKTYEPYTGGKASPNPDYPQEIECIKDSITFKRIGKNYNKYPYFDSNQTSSGVNYEILENHTIQVTGSPTNLSYFDFQSNNSTSRLKLKKGTYTFSATGLQEGLQISIYITDKNGNNLEGYYIHKDSQEPKTVTFDNDIELYSFLHPQKVGYTFNTIVSFQIEKGTEATEYEPYHEDVYTLPIQQNMYALVEGQEDCFVKKDDGKWYERHYSFEGELTGEEVVEISNNRFALFNMHNYGFPFAVYNTNTNQLCNYFIFDNNWADTGYFYASQNTIYLPKIFDTTEEMKAFIKSKYDEGSPVKIVYIREKENGSILYPLDLECTPEQVEVLNKLEQFSLSRGINHIYSDDDLSPKFKLMYYQDMNILLDKIDKNIADVSAQLIEGGSNV